MSSNNLTSEVDEEIGRRFGRIWNGNATQIMIFHLISCGRKIISSQVSPSPRVLAIPGGVLFGEYGGDVCVSCCRRADGAV